jgi:hypothetical protein
MADLGDPGSKHPYHTLEGMPLQEAAGRLARYAATAERMAGEAVWRMVDRLGEKGYETAGLGILESAGRKGSNLAAILASHALIHTADGDHFRNALAAAATRCGVPVVRVPARELESQAASGTGEPVEGLRLTLKAAARDIGPPWGADQKAAGLLAWLVLAKALRPS